METVEFAIEEQLQTSAHELITVGTHDAVCTAFKKLGPLPQLDFNTGQQKVDDMGVPVLAEMCYVEFEVDEADTSGRKKSVRRYMKLAISNEKHALRCLLESWFGAPLGVDADGYARVKPGEIIGKSAKLQILHKKKQSGDLKHVVDKVWPAQTEYVPQKAIDWSLDPDTVG